VLQFYGTSFRVAGLVLVFQVFFSTVGATCDFICCAQDLVLLSWSCSGIWSCCANSELVWLWPKSLCACDFWLRQVVFFQFVEGAYRWNPVVFLSHRIKVRVFLVLIVLSRWFLSHAYQLFDEICMRSWIACWFYFD
jgi:hypothetical protein